jgi:hypothetical protein
MWTFAALAAPPAVRCDAAALERGRQAAEHVAPEHLVALSAQALLEACRWPDPVATALGRLGNGWPGTSDLELATAAPLQLESVCPGGVRALAQGAAMAREDGRRHLYATCRPGFATEAEWTAAPGLLVAPILLTGWLAQSGVAPEALRSWGRSLAGLSDRPEANPVRELRPLFELP